MLLPTMQADSLIEWMALAMAEKLKHMTPDEALIEQAAALRQYIDLLGEIARGGAPEPIKTVEQPSVSALPSDELSDALMRLPLTDAIFVYLKSSKRPKSASQIWTALKTAGREVDAENPIRSVQWALKQLLLREDDIFSPGWGKWHLKSKYSKAALAKLIVKHGGRGGRAHDEHVERTKLGLEKAKARGKTLGAPAKLTPELFEKAKAMVQEPGAKVQEIAKALGVSAPTLYAAGIKVRAYKMKDSTSENIGDVVKLRVVK